MSDAVNFGTYAAAFAKIPALPAVANAYSVSVVMPLVSDKQHSKSDTKFTDPIAQKAWEAYKRIEPRYSDANRKLAVGTREKLWNTTEED